MKKLAYLLIILSSFNAYAQETTNNIERTLKNYADSIGCNFQFDPLNIVPMDMDNDGLPEYIALYYIDYGCSGGSGTTSPAIAVINMRDEFHQDDLYIDLDKSIPYNMVGNPPQLQKLFIKNNQLWYLGKTHSKTDLGNFPSIVTNGLVELVKSKVHISEPKSGGISVYYWKFH